MNRRQFIQSTAGIIAAGSILEACNAVHQQHIRGSIVGANQAAGHLLRDAALMAQPATNTIETGTVIIGGGISGLSAARWLHQQGRQDFLLLELDSSPGGNAAAGKNATSAYPWGAHYVPIPNNNLTEYLEFLTDCNVITGFEKGLPIINEYHLCFAPQERLYINGRWQEGIIPEFGVPAKEQAELRQFLALMQSFRLAKGADGKDAFSIPATASSKDERYTKLDHYTMKEWLLQQQLTSRYLHWYVNYCCRDDFGTDYSRCSAWAGIHYFAGRKGAAANAPAQSVITWPEGNQWLVKQLGKNIGQQTVTDTVALQVSSTAQGVTIKTLNVHTKAITNIRAANCIMATPQFVTARLLRDDNRSRLTAAHFSYQPWMVANITCKAYDERNGAELSWDNVLYQSRALGYVEATHQQTSLLKPNKVLTYYLPLTEQTASIERKLARERSHADWVTIIARDLSAAHTDFAGSTEQIDVWVWGHGMISPQPGFIHGDIRKQLQAPINNNIFFAHTDLAGISIFEEAFYQGINAAKSILA